MNKNAPLAYYAETSARQTAILKKERQKRNAVTVLRIAVFGLLVGDLYGIVALDSPFWIGMAAATLIAFILLGVLDGFVVRRIRYCDEMIRCCRTESGALEDDFDDLPTGEEFADPAHPYAADLDLFGEDSLFRRSYNFV